MAFTVADVKNQAAAVLGEYADDPQLTGTRLYQMVDLAINQVLSMHNWSWRIKTEDVTIDAGSSYLTNVNVDENKVMELVLDENRVIRYVTLREWIGAPVGRGVPRVWTKISGVVRVAPVPAKVTAATAYYIDTDHPNVTADTDEIDMPDRFQEVLALLVASMFARRLENGNLFTSVYAQFQMLVNQLTGDDTPSYRPPPIRSRRDW